MTHRPRTLRRSLHVALLATTTLAVAACSPPGADEQDAAGAAAPTEVSTELGDEPVELVLYDGAGLKAVDDALIAAFTEQHPNVTITTRLDPDDVQAQNAPRVLSSDDPPDIARVNALADIVGNQQLTPLTPWADAYGWDIPEGQLANYTVDDDGVRGSGTQYTVASGYVLTGLYYNREVAEQVGMTTPPTTVEELEAALAQAQAAGVTGILAGNQTGQGTTTVQFLLNNQLGREALNGWVFNQPDATIDTPEAAEAVQTVVDWVDAGYFNADTNGTDNSQALGRFVAGESLFLASGNWDAASLQEQMGDNVGFVLPPGTDADARLSMSNPVSNFGIPAGSDDKDAAAAFLNFLLSDEARQVLVDQGFAPSGSGDAPTTNSALGEEVQTAFADLVTADGQVQFVQDATSGINAAWLSETQLLFDGRTTPEDYLAAIQADYEEELGR